MYGISELSPVELETVHSEGKLFNIVKRTKFTSFFEKYAGRITYHSYISLIGGATPLLTVKNTNKPIAVLIDNVVFIPNVELQKDEEIPFINALLQSLRAREEQQYDLPEWTEKYVLPSQADLKLKLIGLEEKRQKIESEIKTLEEKNSKLNELKMLFSGSGDSLEIGVKTVFVNLGFELLEAVANRDDLILKYEERIVICEIKGVTGTAAEKQATQLEKWISEYHLNNEITPKGLLLVNSFKDMELNDRSDQTWPNQMLNYSVRRNHCLITGLQLLCLYFECKSKPRAADKLIKELLDTDGVYDRFTNWQDYIALSE